ncbi:MAG TPA: class I adenylate-forming enzyme family protein [Streptosporangiaceae bacterium]|nr:class I adenylate-forming enzyme family protein [Streptosporangiaceae bacterium]
MPGGAYPQLAGGPYPQLEPEWVDEVLLGGAADEVCLHLGEPVSRSELRRLVAERHRALADAGLKRGGSVALCLAPSLAFIANLLASWQIGAQASLLDHRLTAYEVDVALQRLLPQVVVTAERSTGGPLRGFAEITEGVRTYPGQPAATTHAVIQLSSGSTGPSKIIARDAANLVEEVKRYTMIDGVPGGGERIVCLASMVHVLGLVGGLLYGLHAGVNLTIPARMTADGILSTLAAGSQPTTLLGVPFHIELLASVLEPPKLPQLTGMTTGGELVRADVYEAFTGRYGVRLGNMYGMTEVGVIATDLFGEHRPAVLPAPGLAVREEGGELHVSLPASPYLGVQDPSRWSDGWLHTRDAGTVDSQTGLVRVLGRRDSQVSVGGLKVDLTEVEHMLAALPEVTAAVVVHDHAIEAYLVLADGAEVQAVERAITTRLAPFKRPRRLHVVGQLPRTATGKLVRDQAVLRDMGSGQAGDAPQQKAGQAGEGSPRRPG